MKDVDFDFERSERIGVPEIVYGEHKTLDQLQHIVELCQTRSHDILISRLQSDKAVELSRQYGGDFDPVGRTWIWRGNLQTSQMHGLVAVVSGGTADAPVVAECLNTLDFLSVATTSIQDVGVAGIHRLLRRLDTIRGCDIAICIAGFEGALASVVSGSVAAPVIGVPTSVGYGVSAGGQAALHAMLSSCASGLMVMNVDNGVGAALAAKRILRVKPSD